MKIRNALIVGGTSGIGLGVAQALSDEGVTAYVIGRRSLGNKNKILPRINYLQMDLTGPKALERIIVALNGIKLDYVVFSGATETPLKKFSDITEQEYDYAFSLNVKVPFLLTKALLPNLNINARLLFITSRLSASPEIGSLVYCMTKSALEIFSDGLNKELKGVLFSSSIIPGVVDTEMQKRLRDADPRVFPNTYIYQEMLSKLQTVKEISSLIVSHLCETNDDEFSRQRINLVNMRLDGITSKL